MRSTVAAPRPIWSHWARQTGWLAAMLVVFVTMLTPVSLYYPGMWPGVSDEDAYLSHALTIGLDFDLDYSNEPIRQLNPRQTAPLHAIGPGLMAAPFVALLSVVDRLQRHPIVGDHTKFITSWALFGFLFSKVAYFFVSLWLYFDGARRIQRDLLSPGMTFLLAAGASLMYYVLGRFAMGHLFEFCTHGLIFWASVVLWQRLRRTGLSSGGFRVLLLPALLAEAGVVLNLLIRTASLHVLLLPQLIIGVLLLTSADETGQFKWRVHLALVAMLAICLIPAELIFFHFYGKPFPSAYDQYGPSAPGAFKASSLITTIGIAVGELPRVPYILFSDDFGLLYSSPLLIVGTALLLAQIATGLFRHRRVTLHGLAVSVGAVAYIGAAVAVSLATQKRGEDYGWRFLFSLYPPAFLGYVLSLRALRRPDVRRRWLARAVSGTVAVLCAFSILGQVLYGANDRLTARSKQYETGVLYAVGTPAAWTRAMLVRLPTYIAIRAWPIPSRDLFDTGARFGMTRETLLPYVDILNRTVDAPARISAQLVVVSVFWVAGSFWFLFMAPPRQSRVSPEPEPGIASGAARGLPVAVPRTSGAPPRLDG